MVFGLKKKKNDCFHSMGGDDWSFDNDDFRPSPRGRQRDSDPSSPSKPKRKDRSASAVRKIVSAFTHQTEKSPGTEEEESGRPSVLPAPSGDLDMVSLSPIRTQNRWRPRTPVRRKDNENKGTNVPDDTPANEFPMFPQSEVDGSKRAKPCNLRPAKSPARGKMEATTEQSKIRSPRKSPRRTRQTNRDDDYESTMNGSVNSFASFGGNAFDWTTSRPKSPGRRSPLGRFRAKQAPKLEEHETNHTVGMTDDASISESVVFKRFETLEERRPSLLATPSFADMNVDMSAETDAHTVNSEIQKNKTDRSFGSPGSLLGKSTQEEDIESSETSSHFSEISGCHSKASRPNLHAVPSPPSMSTFQKPNLLSSTSYHGQNIRPPVTNNNRLRRGSNGSLPSILRTNSYSSKHTMDKVKKQANTHKDKNDIDIQVNHQSSFSEVPKQELIECPLTARVNQNQETSEEPKQVQETKVNNVTNHLKSHSERRSRTCGSSLRDDRDNVSVFVKSLVTPTTNRCKTKMNADRLSISLEDGISSLKRQSESSKDNVQKSKVSSRANKESSSVISASSTGRERASRSSAGRSPLSKSMHAQCRKSPRQVTRLELNDRRSIHTSRPSKSPGSRSKVESGLDVKSKENSDSQITKTPTRRKRHQHEENPTTPVEKSSKQSSERSENYSTPSKRRSRSTDISSESTEKISTPSRKHQSRPPSNKPENREKTATPSKRRQSRTIEASLEKPEKIATPSKRRSSSTADSMEKVSAPSRRHQSRPTENVENTASSNRHSCTNEVYENSTPSAMRKSNPTQNSETISRRKEKTLSNQTNEDPNSPSVPKHEKETEDTDVQVDESPTRRTTSFDARARKVFIEEMKRDLAKEPIKTEEPVTPAKSPRLRLRGLKFPTGNRAPKSVEPLDVPSLEEKLTSSLSAMEVDMSKTKSKGGRDFRRPAGRTIARSMSTNTGISSEPLRMKVKLKKKSHAHDETDNALSGIAQLKLPSEKAAMKVEYH